MASSRASGPGGPTQEYLAQVVFRITIAGAFFLGIVAVAP